MPCAFPEVPVFCRLCRAPIHVHEARVEGAVAHWPVSVADQLHLKWCWN